MGPISLEPQNIPLRGKHRIGAQCLLNEYVVINHSPLCKALPVGVSGASLVWFEGE